eukprot:3433254-Pyramimonas_sp.AAC.1
MRAAFHVSESTIAVKDLDGLAEWDRTPDTGILVANTTANVDRETLVGVLAPWLRDAKIPDDEWKLLGSTPSR